ncbi:hypothetical protein [Vibrio cholerae]|uniref:hypothetical protein n=1 Tax=Vibrio cholerae TaxID=666 RepID=UPI003080F125|nr:hypothetical protein [Vibrio parahaemolyticus]
MENLAKSISEYKKWKSSLKDVLDQNFNEIAGLVVDVYGSNRFIEVNVDRSQYNPVVNTGVIVNVDQYNGDYLIWFYKDNAFYLIERGADSGRINFQPVFIQDSRHPWLTNFIPNYRARFDNEVDFVLMMLDWSEELVGVLKERMKKVDPQKAEKAIKDLISTAQ